jgi:hypothetical protein
MFVLQSGKYQSPQKKIRVFKPRGIDGKEKNTNPED